MQRYESYKPSGAEWLGDIPAHWTVTPAKRLFREVSEKNHPDAELLSVTQEFGVVPRDQLEQRVVMPTGQLQTFKLVREDDFVISLRSFQGGIEYSEFTGLVSPAYTILRKQKDANSRYLKHLLKSAPFISELNTSVTGIREGKNISFSEMAYSLLPLPALTEQARIADFLDIKTAEIDAAIAKKERLIELLQEQKNIRIHQAVLRGLNPEVPLCDSGVSWIGAVPAHWKVIPNRYIFREQNARSLRGEETHLSMSQRYGLVPAKELDVQTLQSESYDGAKLCQKGDLVQNRLKAHLAVFAVAPCDGLVSPDYSVFRLQNSENQPVYFVGPAKFKIRFPLP
jgi:type I restriction enzyme S subunit